MFWLGVLFAITSLNFIISEPCELFETCGECIGNSLRCAWCPDQSKTGPRCVSSGRLNATWCLKPYNPETLMKTNETNQFTPSNIIIKARPGDNVTFNITYKPTTDYPIDIYYLFDNSHTMRYYKTNLVQQAQKIYDTLKNESNNVRFGAGSFVEKLALPFASQYRTNLNTFNNHLSLTNNIDIFVETVKKNNSENNLDDPECGLDALMQVMVCEEEIGWRPDARRLIILSTDDVYHSAGDGRAVGAYLQNDMKCHLVNSKIPNIVHTYDQQASLLYDYPSVSQVNYIASKKNMLIFFVAKNTVAREYKALAEAISGAEFVELATDKEEGNDLAEIIKGQYKRLMKNLDISTPVLPPHLQLSLNPDCTKKNKQCSVPHHGSRSLNATLHVKSCPEDNLFEHTFTIKAAGLPDKVTVVVEVLCECDCEKNGEKRSSMCSVNGTSHGTYQCGVCKCDKGWYGEKCQCAGHSTEKDDLLKCTPPSAGAKPCSSRGDCECGTCKCWKGYDSSDQCQRRTDKCPTYKDKPCAEHGSCDKGICRCIGPWTGASCECSTDNATCVGANGQICSGNGICKCGGCVCQNETKNYGRFCSECDTCGDERCKQLKDYVLCLYDGEKLNGKISCDVKHEIKTNISVEIKNQTEVEGWSDGYYCKTMLPDESHIIYKYLDGNNSTLIWIQNEKELPPERNIWIPIGSAIGTMVLIGILTVIAWKVLVDIHDAREYRKFAEEAEKSGFDVMQNPLYKPAAVSINNPAYSG